MKLEMPLKLPVRIGCHNLMKNSNVIGIFGSNEEPVECHFSKIRLKLPQEDFRSKP